MASAAAKFNGTELREELTWQSRLPDLLRLLAEQPCSAKDLPDCLRGLLLLLHEHKWVQAADVRLMEAWIKVGSALVLLLVRLLCVVLRLY